MSNDARRLKLVIGGLILGGFAVAVEVTVGWRAILAPWARVPPALMATALALLIASYALRALRLHAHFADLGRGQLPRLLRLVLLHNALNNWLPMRIGEVSFPWLMHRYFAMPALRAIPALLWLRALDLHALLTWAGTAFLWAWHPGYAAAFAAVVIPLPWLGWHLLARVLPAATPSEGARWFTRLASGLPQRRASLWQTVALTHLLWVAKLSGLAVLLKSLAELPWWWAFVGSAGGDLTSVLPVHGLAGGGTFEAGVLLALTPANIPTAQALTAAVGIHLMLLTSATVMVLPALLLPGMPDGFRQKRGAARAHPRG